MTLHNFIGGLILFLSLSKFTCFSWADEYSNGAWRSSLDGEGSCWTDPSCARVMTTAHGGEWNLTFPYDSMPAFMKAYEDGADAVKGDFRVSMDNIGMVMHSSPVEIYESPNCWGKYVEEMTAEECMQCKMELTNYTFTSAPDLLQWADGKINVMFCVKESEDTARAISTLLENGAEHRAFLEVHVGDLLKLEADAVAGWDQVYYVAEIKSAADLDSMLNASPTMRSRAFLLEYSNWEEWSGDRISEDIAAAKALGFRTFAPSHDGPITATVANHLRLFHTGFDVAYTYNLGNAVEARIDTNTFRDISPP